MIDVFFRGAVAGFGIAIPVGAIAVLIVETGRRWRFWVAASAGLGAALADLIYATIAGIVGAGVSGVLATHALIIHWAGGIILGILALRTLRGALRASDHEEGDTTPPRRSRLVLSFLGLTLTNPLTVVYFAALVASSGQHVKAWALLPFVIGVFVASFTWQCLLAAVGTLMGRALPPATRQITGVVGSIIIGVLAIRAVVGA